MAEDQQSTSAEQKQALSGVTDMPVDKISLDPAFADVMKRLGVSSEKLMTLEIPDETTLKAVCKLGDEKVLGYFGVGPGARILERFKGGPPGPAGQGGPLGQGGGPSGSGGQSAGATDDESKDEFPPLPMDATSPAQDPFCLLRPQLTQKILNGLKDGHVLVTSPPGSGKTSLYKVVKAASPNSFAYLSCLDLNREQSETKSTDPQSIQQQVLGVINRRLNKSLGTLSETDSLSDPLIICLDECHTIYDQQSFWDSVKTLSSAGPVRILGIASTITSGGSSSDVFFASPAVFHVNLVWKDLQLREDETNELVGKMRNHPFYQNDACSLVFNVVLPLLQSDAGGHIALFRIILQCALHEAIHMRKEELPVTSQYISRWYYHRSFLLPFLRRVFSAQVMEEVHRDILRRLLLGQHVYFDSSVSTRETLPYHWLARRMIIAPLFERQFGTNEWQFSTNPRNHKEIEVGFATPLHAQFFLRQAFESNIETPPTDIDQFIVDAVRQFIPAFLSYPLAHGTSRQFPLEATFQQQFARSASLLLPQGHILAAEVSRPPSASSANISGRIDFVINSSLEWGIELLATPSPSDMAPLDSHIAKMEESYAQLGFKLARVVDFRPGPAVTLPIRQAVVVWIDPSFKEATVEWLDGIRPSQRVLFLGSLPRISDPSLSASSPSTAGGMDTDQPR